MSCSSGTGSHPPGLHTHPTLHGISWDLARRLSLTGPLAMSPMKCQLSLAQYKPNVVHIMMGLMDEEATYDSSLQFVTQNYLASVQTIVKEVRAANAVPILALEPGGWSPENAVIAAYGSSNNILVLGYENVPMAGTSYYQGATYIPTPGGFATMNQIVTQTIATLNSPLQGGYLQNEMEQSGDWPPQPNINTWTPGAVIDFTAVGYYAGGVIYPQLNTNLQGNSTGTWT